MSATVQITVPVVETARLRLRCPEARDFEAYAAFRAGPRSVLLGGPFDRVSSFNGFCALVGHWQMRGFGRWIVADRDSDEALGVVGIFHPADWPEPEVAWSVFDAAEGKGIAAEAAVAARNWAYDVLGWERLVSLITPDNLRSQALATRLGCVREGDYPHPDHGPLHIYRHLSPAELGAR